MTADVSVEAMIAADDIAYQFHINAPKDNEAAFAGLVERRARILARWDEARACGDWELARRLILDALNVNYVTAAAREALEAQRRIVRGGGFPPGSCRVYCFPAEP